MKAAQYAAAGRWLRQDLAQVKAADAQQRNRPHPLLRLLWWAGYLAAAIFLQQQFPGLDALTPGFLLALQERRPVQTFWLFLLFALIQEGTGSLHFGMAMLWYGGQILIFRLNSQMFVTDNILFISILSASLGAYYGVLLWFMCVMLDIPPDYILLLRASLLQALAIPLIWGLARLFRLKEGARAR
ncbi:MAG: hypothetical protein LBJ82_03550 [Deltaproteobacteria bacterium]|jgi:hypothetical protein|nr:hypothetical protein [Deltaproteobacteria bacterium]